MELVGCGLSKSFGALAALSDVDVSVSAGEVLGIAGPNGAGKSTLFDVLSGHTNPDSGSVELGGREVTRLGAFRRARLGLARTFQSPIVPGELTVGEVLSAATVAWKSDGRGDLSTADASALVKFDVAPERIAGPLDTLSRRKLLLACLLLRRPTVLLMDEPCSGLLADEVDEIEDIVNELRDQAGVAIVMVEHRLELLTAVSDRILVLDQGKVIVEGKAADVFAHPAAQAAYFQGHDAKRATEEVGS